MGDSQPVTTLRDLAAVATCGRRFTPPLRSSCSSVVQVLKVNGQQVNNLKEMVAAVVASKEQYLSLDLEYNQVDFLHQF